MYPHVFVMSQKINKLLDAKSAYTYYSNCCIIVTENCFKCFYQISESAFLDYCNKNLNIQKNLKYFKIMPNLWLFSIIN